MLRTRLLKSVISFLRTSVFILFIVLPGIIKGQINKRDEKPLKLVFISTCVGEDFFKSVKKGMADAAKLMEIECSFIGTEEVNVEMQAQMVSHAVKDGIDGIALNIIDPLAFDEVVEEVMQMGIPVVAFNVDDNKTPNARLSSVCQNLFKAGEELGKLVARDIPENSTVLITMHSEGISALEDRMAGIKYALKEKNLNYEFAVTGITSDKASVVISDKLKANPAVKAILCTGLADTEGAGIALENISSGREIVSAGFDLSQIVLEQIKKGNLQFTIDQQPYMQGFYPVIQLVQFLRYGIVPSDNEIGACFVNKENVHEVELLVLEGYR